MFSPSVQKLIEIFSKFPTVGPRTAARFVFYLLKLPKEEVENLISSISKIRESVKLCKFCFNPFENETSSIDKEELCEICQNATRDRTLLCVIEKETDLVPLEKTRKFLWTIRIW